MPLNKDDGVVWIQFGQIFSARVLQNYIAKCHANYRFVSDASLFPHPLSFWSPKDTLKEDKWKLKFSCSVEPQGSFLLMSLESSELRWYPKYLIQRKSFEEIIFQQRISGTAYALLTSVKKKSIKGSKNFQSFKDWILQTWNYNITGF